MNYNIVTTCDQSYFTFLKILINSILKVCDLSKINSIYIINTGLTDEQIGYLYNKSSLIKVINTGHKTNFNGGVWGKDWALNVKTKSLQLQQLLNEIKEPTLMLDCDMMVMKDLHLLVEQGGDLQVCFRPGHGTPYIASYLFVLDYNKTNSFIDEWTKLVNRNYKPGAPFESPALGQIVKKYKNLKTVNIVEIDQFTVNVTEPKTLKNHTIIVHFKGSINRGEIEGVINSRLYKRGWEDYIKPYLN